MGNKQKHSPLPIPHSPLLSTTLAPALLGGLLFYLAVPPVDWGFLGWVAPVPWIWLARRIALPLDRPNAMVWLAVAIAWPLLGVAIGAPVPAILIGELAWSAYLVCRRPYVSLWFAGFLYWLGAIHWLGLPHPATNLGWLALSFYLGFYAPIFVGLLRVAVHRLHLPIMLAAPLIWMGLEKAEAHIWTGFGMGSLGHTQYRLLPIIQVADLFGGYTVSGVVMAVAASIAALLPCDNQRWRPRQLVAGALVLAATLAYGFWRLAEYDPQPGPTITLIQGSVNTELKADPGSHQRIFDEYRGLSHQAKLARPDTQLIVWPETMYRYPIIQLADGELTPPEGWTLDELQARAAQSVADVHRLADELGTPLLLGVDAIDYTPTGPEHFNSAILVSLDGRTGPRYDKMHPVIFGEYVPLAKYLPWIYRMTPLTGGIEAGEEPQAMTIELRDGRQVRLSPSICYETVLGRVIRRQVARLKELGQEPDVLVNLTNDGWFWGSSELDMHLICGVFRAVECRKPLVIAANTGFSGWIDSTGRILAQGPRQDAGWIVADVQLDGRATLYVLVGDWPVLGCLAGCFGLAVVGWRARRRARAA